MQMIGQAQRRRAVLWVAVWWVCFFMTSCDRDHRFEGDTDPPRVTVTSPPSGAALLAATVHVMGTVSEPTSGPATVTCNGRAAAVTGETFQCQVTLGEGPQTIVVQATDRAGNTATARVEVRVASAHQAPMANGGPGQTVRVGQRVTLDGSSSTDAEGDPLAYAWTLMTVPIGSQAVLEAPTQVRAAFVVDRPGTYGVQLMVNDGQHDSIPALVTITTQNSPPVADVGPEQTAAVGTSVSLDGSHSSDVDGDALTYSWAVLSHPPSSTIVVSAPYDVRPTVVLDAPGTYVFQLTVHDGVLASAPATVRLSTENSPPVADAGLDQAVMVGDTVPLDGGRSHDVDGETLTFHWAFLAQPRGSRATLTEPTGVSPTFVVDQPGLYVVQLLVHDGHTASAPDTVSITTQNARPVAAAGSDQVVAVGDTVQLDGRQSYDANGDPLRYRWSFSTTPPGSLAALSDASLATPTFLVDVPGLYVVQLLVNDGDLSSVPDTVTISTRNHPPVAQAGAAQTVRRGEPVRLDGRASWDPDGDPITFAWTMVGRPAASTATLADATTSTPTFVADQPGTYQAQLVVHDGTAASSPSLVTITASAPPAPLEAQYITIESRPDGQVTVTGQAPAGSSGRRVMATNERTGQQVTATVAPDGHFTLALAAQEGNTLALVIIDAAGGQSAPLTVIVKSPLPPDPATVAPPLDPTVATTLVSAAAFLYTGPAPIQQGVAVGTIEPWRVAVVRGKVLDRTDTPVSGVTITVKDHPEFGQTVSRADGLFDLVVNGGGLLTLHYTRDGFLPVQRQVHTPWQDYVVVDDIVLVTLDPQVTPITGNSASGMQVAQGSPSRDAAGTRQATLLFPAGTMVRMQLPDGTTQPLPTLHVRATEYSVGPPGPKALPGPLPPTSAYTYAVELSVDEALAAGATRVDFSQPVLMYVDNFLGFPVGGIVPVGWYDRDTVAWIPVDNGTIVRLLGVDTTGLALLDVDGSGATAVDSTLRSMGISAAEQARLATLYAVGTSLWRVPMTHFTP